MSFGNLLQDHDEDALDCAGCEEHFGGCSCGGVVHCEYQEAPKRDRKSGCTVIEVILVLECDRCDEYEIQ